MINEGLSNVESQPRVPRSASDSMSRRHFLVGASGAVALATLAACGGHSGRTAGAQTGTAGASGGTAGKTTLTFWSHWASLPTCKQVLMDVAQRLEAANPNLHVQFTWYDLQPLDTALRASFQADQGPDLFYLDTATVEFITSGQAADLTNAIDLANLTPGSVKMWQEPGPNGKTGLWAVPLEVYTSELYYNMSQFEALGIDVPSDYAFTQDQLTDVVRKSVKAGKSAFAVGVGDRQFPGAYMIDYLLLSKLGADDLKSLWLGNGVTWHDPRVQEVFEYHQELVSMGAYPKSISTMKLAEAHQYFYQQQGATMMPVGSWFTDRAFVPVADGGMPSTFKLGMLNFPKATGGKGWGLKFEQAGGAFAAYAKGKHLTEALELLKVMDTPATGLDWMQRTQGLTGIKTDASQLKASPYTWYFELYDKVNKSTQFANLDWQSQMKPGMLQTYVQIVNQALPENGISVSKALDQLQSAQGS